MQKCGKEDRNTTKPNEDESNMKDHNENEFQRIVKHGLIESGIHCCASKNHGKTRLLFSMAKHLQTLSNVKVLVFDGSETWLYSYSQIPVFTISERDITLSNENKSIEEVEKYEWQNWHLVTLALENYKDLLFRLKTRKPSKRGFAIRSIINYLDSIQRQQRQATETHEPKNRIAYFIEESQDAFNPRSQNRTESEEFLTVFNEARNQQEAFFTASQRLTDFAKTMRTKQLYCIGKCNSEDVNGFLRRLEKMHNIDFSDMKPRTWFFEGLTFKSPTWKQEGKPFKINRDIKQKWLNSLPRPEQEQKRKTLAQRLKEWLMRRFEFQTSQTYEEPEPISQEDKESQEDGYLDRDEEEDSDLIEFNL